MTEVVPEGVSRGYPLVKLTTVRTGGNADFFARPETVGSLIRMLAWARDDGLEIGMVGSGSNLLVADSGFHGLVIKLAGDLADIEKVGSNLVAGGGVRLPSAAAKTAGWGLAGLEFGVNIPGTTGGAVKMNANAYGGRLEDVIDWVELSTADGPERVNPDQLDFEYRHSNITSGRVVSRVAFALRPDEPEAIKRRLAEMRRWRKEAQPAGIKTFGSTFKNPDDERAEGRSAGQLLDAAGCRGLMIGGAGLAERHANFVENKADATTAEVVAVMAEARCRVKETFGISLEPEVQTLGQIDWPPEWDES